MRRRLLTLAVSVSLACGLCPTGALAERSDSSEAQLPLSAEFTTSRSVVSVVPLSGDSDSKNAATWQRFDAGRSGGHGTGGASIRLPVKSVHEADEISLFSARELLPASYSSVDEGVVTPVGDQGYLGSCWAFAAIASAESSVLSQGLANEVDLSERHLVYFTYHRQADRLGGTTGDGLLPADSSFADVFEGTDDPYLGTGGNGYFAMSALASWMGMADESIAPYQELTDKCEQIDADDAWKDKSVLNKFLSETALNRNDAFEASYHLKSCSMIAMKDRDDVKRAIRDNGAVAISYYADDDPRFYNAEYSAYYNYEEENSNHDVAVVGWDDNFDKNKFASSNDPNQESSEEEDSGAAGSDTEATQGGPMHDGAWLVKNSWGTGWGEGGYFWISYEDVSLNTDYATAWVYGVAPADEYDNNYQYDGAAGVYGDFLPSGSRCSNVFTVRANPGGCEKLRAISLVTGDVNLEYSIQVYLNPTKAKDPESGTPALSRPVTGTTSYEGFYTIPLNHEIPLSEGDVFSVVVKLTHADGSDVFWVADGSADYGFAQSVSVSRAGQSFMDNPSGGWDDLALETDDDGKSLGLTARIKAFTSNASLESFAEASVAAVGAQTYTGRPLTPEPVVTMGGKRLTRGIDYELSYRNNVDPGTATITVSGRGLYRGSKTIAFSIVRPKVSLSAASISVKPKAWTGKAQKCAVPTVKIDGKTLRNGTDFTYTCKAGKAVGSYKVTITGKGDYVGTKSATFKIVPRGTSVSKLSKGKKAFAVKWKKPSKAALKQTTGYQIRWSTSKKFTAKTTKSKTVKTASAAGKRCQLKVAKLKAGKRYYVQVRTYKKVGKVTYYSAWSKAKAVVTKK